MYHAVSETDPMLPTGGKHVDSGPGSGSVRTMRLETPAPKCHDWFFAVLFLVHIVVIAVFAFWQGIPAVQKRMTKVNNSPAAGADTLPTTEKEENYEFNMVFVLGVALNIIAAVLALVWMKVLMMYAASMIRIALWLNVVLLLVAAGTTLSSSVIGALIFLGLAGINVCFIYLVRNRIAFASANLEAACSAVSEHTGVFLVALLCLVKQIIWLLLWSLAAIGIYQMFKDADPECDRAQEHGTGPDKLCGGTAGGVVLFFMLISVYWGQQVLQNILTCTTAGIVASWWYQPNAKKVTLGALYRSLTTSFGSICFGSLLVAVLQALRTMASLLKEQAEENNNAVLACLACLAECILNCVASIMEYINQWAYVYVGIYGYDFKTSGKAVMDLFNNRGWTAVINDDLTQGALMFGALGVGCINCCIALLIVKFSPADWFIALGSTNAAYGTLGVIGFIAGMSMAMILAHVVIAALHTVFVCFAEDPIAFSRNHPREYEDLVSGWRQFHGDALVSAYGNAV